MSGFDNSTTAGDGTLILTAIKSPDYSPGVAGWSVNRDGSAEFNDAVIRGTVVITNTGEELLVYDGQPAAGNLIASIAAQAGTDAYGNAFPQGIGAQAADIVGQISTGTVGKRIVMDPGSQGKPEIDFYNTDGSNHASIVASDGTNPGDPSLYIATGVSADGQWYGQADFTPDGMTFGVYKTAAGPNGSTDLIDNTMLYLDQTQLTAAGPPDATGLSATLAVADWGVGVYSNAADFKGTTLYVDNVQTMNYGAADGTDWQTVTPATGWANRGSGYATFAAKRLPTGAVMLKGELQPTAAPTGTSKLLGTLPQTWLRPAQTMTLPVGIGGGNVSVIQITPAGAITLYWTSAYTPTFAQLGGTYPL